MTLREEVLKNSGLLTEEVLEEGIVNNLFYPTDIFELVDDPHFLLQLKSDVVDKKTFGDMWDKLDKLVSNYEPDKTKEIEELVEKMFDMAKKGKAKGIEDAYTFKYAYSNKNPNAINKYREKTAVKTGKMFTKYNEIELRILSNLKKLDKRYREYKKDE